MRDWMMDLCNLPSVRVLWGELASGEEDLQGSVVGDRQIISNLALTIGCSDFSFGVDSKSGIVNNKICFRLIYYDVATPFF
jgi:hypothetical protein